MNKPFSDNNSDISFNKLRSLQLSATEKSDMRRNLEEHIDTHQPSPSPWAGVFDFVSPTIERAAVVTAVLLFALGGLTYAAEDALPGSPLYAVKTNVNENFASFTAFSSSKAAQTQSELAARRIDELRALVTENKLTAHTSNDLLSDIANHTELARRSIDDLRAESRDKGEAAEQLSSQLRALLAVKGDTLRKIAADSRDTDATTSEVATQAAERLLAIAEASGVTAASNETVSSASPEAAVRNLLATATNQLANTYQRYRAVETKKTTPPQPLVAAAHALSSAVTDIEAADYNQAIEELDTVLQDINAARDWLAVNTSTNTDTKEAGSSTTAPQLAAAEIETASTTTSTASAVSEEETNQSTSSLVSEAATSSSSASLQSTGTDSATTSTSTTAGSSSDTSLDTSDTADTRLPTKQVLHNKTIQDAIATARSLLSDRSAAPSVSQEAATSTATTTVTDSDSTTTTSANARSSENDESDL